MVCTWFCTAIRCGLAIRTELGGRFDDAGKIVEHWDVLQVRSTHSAGELTLQRKRVRSTICPPAGWGHGSKGTNVTASPEPPGADRGILEAKPRKGGKQASIPSAA